MKNFELIIFIIIIFIKLTQNQPIPYVPCPDIFSYIINSKTGQVEGRVSILDIQPGRENLISVKMTYPPYVINNNAGKIVLAKRNEDVVKDIKQHQPVIYKIGFPTIDPLPTLQEIVFNEITICSSSYFERGNSEIDLIYRLSVPNINVIPNSYSGTSNRNSIQLPQNTVKLSARRPPAPQNTASDNSNSCGNSQASIRLIVGGDKLQPGEWPWLAAVFRRTSTGQLEYTCSASVIAPHAVITAAHCVIENGRTKRPQDMLVGLGLFELNRWNDPSTFIANVYNIIPHPDYGSANVNRHYDGDIAIIILDRSYPYNHRIQPICMWVGKSDINQVVDEQGHVAGWGVSKSGGGTERLPSVVEAEIVSTNTCLNSNPAIGDLISARNFCAGYLNGHGPCKGDSGSGFMIERGGRWYLRGVVSGALSHVKRTCNLNEYVIYTDAAKFRKWIRLNINN